MVAVGADHEVSQAAAKDQKWFTEYSKDTKPGIPLPFHEKLGLTKEEYDDYLLLWSKREFKVAQEITLLLRRGSEGRWNIIASVFWDAQFDKINWTGNLGTTLPGKNDAGSKAAAWTGKEWRFEEETTLSKLKENFAIGTTADNKYHLLVYRAQEMTSNGTRLLDKNLVLRIANTAPAAKDPAKDPVKAPTKPAVKTTAPSKPNKR